MNKQDLKQLIKEEIAKTLSEGVSLNMNKIFQILKDNGYEPKITKGNKVFGIKKIMVNGKIWGRTGIESNGEMFGSDMWNRNITSEEEVLDAMRELEKDAEIIFRSKYDD